MGHIVICGLSGSTIVSLPYLMNGMIFEKKKAIEHEVCFDFLHKVILKICFFIRRIERGMIKNVY